MKTDVNCVSEWFCAAVPVEHQNVLVMDLCVDSYVFAGVVWAYDICCVFMLSAVNLKQEGNVILHIFFH